ncbi:TetR/AcrR family transcriptional regulator [Grimontia hollisae]|uniref:Transcriptional regulator n=2 Tax=Grimontia hollisae TaxID=673 RepID=D0IBC3_GRIHO|nr:TetR/AcrR family transcriptional regulator [Grimontia hollisae]AMG29581.1 TetR/AcrR family transcriptional regulator [Grimontia hollisae]EEY71191.1 transcriptional regulator [Grimontia hollisae CIP 101886]MDF2186511.1 TetR/AcrR family transcriptional regulator [Grimontia hollisae]STO43885.1 HTH-type transcriptional repressor nemR [Grimontia hollisae]STO57138.1 HTH-type transcriptional repressor nemR [Grimontia hollisae]
MNTETQSTRQHILNVGYELIVEKGFYNVGLAQLLNHAGVPKGSFYHYFKSKEQFGEALIEEYFAQYRAKMDAHFSDSTANGYDKLMGYWAKWLEMDDGMCATQRCLVVKLSAEVSDLSESMRLSLLNGANRIVAILADCVQNGIDDGSVKVEDAYQTANQLYHLWIGASLMSKLNQNVEPMKQALKTTQHLLSGQHPF